MTTLSTLDKPILSFLDNIQEFDNTPLLQSAAISSLFKEEHISFRDCYFFKLTEVSYDDEYPRREAFENVLATLDSHEFNFVYLISGKPQGVDIFLGVVRNYGGAASKLRAADFADTILRTSLQGNFQGSKLKPLSRTDITNQIFVPLQQSRRASLITGIPSIHEHETNIDVDFQGIDRLIHSMAGVNWQFLVVCEPMKQAEIEEMKQSVYDMYNEIHRYAKVSLQHSRNEGTNSSESEGKNESRSETTGTSENRGTNSSKSNSSGNSSSSTGSSETKGTSKSINETAGWNTNKTRGNNRGKSEAVTVELVSKQASEVLDYINEELLERLKLGKGKGLFKTAMYALAPDYATHERLQRSITSIFQGNKSTFSPLKEQRFPEDVNREDVTKLLCHFQIPAIPSSQSIASLLYGLPVTEKQLYLGTFMTAREVSLLAGLPIKEVPGLALKEGVDFGLNAPVTSDGVQLGHLLHRGRELTDITVSINKDSLNKHIFIAGVTGSGKTTTCQRILMESDLPFFVIEPAKTEYRALYGKVEDLQFFTLGNERLAPFRINPFELLPHESISSHVDMLKATFSAVFPMEAAMPQLLEAAIYDVYEKYGWNFETNENDLCENPWEQNGLYFPTFTDLLQSLQQVVKKQGFGAELQADYVGSLVSRVSNLTIGAKGSMLNCKTSINFHELLHKKVVFEMEDIRSPEDKALLMGFILTRLMETLKAKHYEDPTFKHITLIEEAHRLLARAEPGESGAKKLAVEMFADMLAEVRKYGEGLIIVDQIPNKLTPDVLKNTNTKIIHKLFAKDDKDAVGDTMALTDQQKEYLSKMVPGEAVMFSQNWHQAVNIQVRQGTNTTDKMLGESVMQEIGKQELVTYQQSYFPALGLAKALLQREQLVAYPKERRLVLTGWKQLGSQKNKLDEGTLASWSTTFRKFTNQLQLSKDTAAAILAHEITLQLGMSCLDEVYQEGLDTLQSFLVDSIAGNITYILSDRNLRNQIMKEK